MYVLYGGVCVRCVWERVSGSVGCVCLGRGLYRRPREAQAGRLPVRAAGRPLLRLDRVLGPSWGSET